MVQEMFCGYAVEKLGCAFKETKCDYWAIQGEAGTPSLLGCLELGCWYRDGMRLGREGCVRRKRCEGIKIF